MKNGNGHAFVQNPVPSFREEHLATVQQAREGLTELMKKAYPEAYKPGFKGRPRLAIPLEALEQGIERILNPETVDFLINEEAAVRPIFEEAGLATVFNRILPAATTGYTGSTPLQVKEVVDAQCVGCMKTNHFNPLAGFIRGVEYDVGEPVILEYLANSGRESVIATDARLAADDGLRLKLTPECKKHGKDNVFQLAVVHELIVVDQHSLPKNGQSENGIRPASAQAVPGSPILEARLKTSFEYLWKLVQLYGGRRPTDQPYIPDTLAARVRVANEPELALSLVRVMMALPQIDWYGAIRPKNFENFDKFMTQQLEGKNGYLGYFKAHILHNSIPERNSLVIVKDGLEEPARVIELLAPFGNGHGTAGSNIISVLFFIDDEYTRMNGTKQQDRIGYQQRREDIRTETSTAGDWMIAQRLRGISLDPSSVAYNGLVTNKRLAEAIARESSKDTHRKEALLAH